jgi:HEAT repeat protein
MSDGEGTKALIEQLRDPIQSHRAVLALAMKGPDAVPALAEFLRSSKPSSLSEPRLMAVECLSILKGPETLKASISVCSQRLNEIADPIVRLAEEAVVSSAALALADYPDDDSARETLLKLLQEKPLVGVAEAFEKLKDPRAISGLVAWLEEDFVAEAAWRAIVACGRAAVPLLIESLKEKHVRYGTETSASRRRRGRVLAILRELAEPADVAGLEDLLEDPVEGVRWNAVHLFVEKGSDPQKQRAFQVGMAFLDSADSFMRSECEELLLAHFDLVRDLIEQEIDRRRREGEAEESFEPRETTLGILCRIFRKGCRATGTARTVPSG